MHSDVGDFQDPDLRDVLFFLTGQPGFEKGSNEATISSPSFSCNLWGQKWGPILCQEVRRGGAS